MNAEISAHGLVPIGNLLVVEDNGNVWSRTVSQVYGRAILGAMALRLNRLPFRVLHESNLSQHETLTLDNVRKAAQAVAPSDNFIFINDSRRILSCQVNSNYGVALLKSLQQQTPEEGSQTQPVLSHANAIQASDNDNNRDIAMESYEYASQDLEQPYANGSSSSQKTSAASLEILSDKILSSANRQPYDRDWMERYNISDDYLNGSVSKHRLDVIVNHGAVKVGDKLCVTYDPDGGPVAGFGEVGFRSVDFCFCLDAKIPSLPRFCRARKAVVWICESRPAAQTSMASSTTAKPPRTS